MAETMHTPGPWKLMLAGDGIQKFAPATADGVSILTLVDEDGVKFATVFEEADARLIAAAPEMLEALRSVVAALGGRVHSRDALAALDAAEEAISKVTLP